MTESQQRVAAVVKKVSTSGEAPGVADSLFDTGAIDSFGLTDLVGELESEFGVRIPEADLHPRNFRSIEEIDIYLQALKQK